ncbi:L-aspartate oxidase [Herbiconiux moechotypicola]|uniref:L-aspartate oxidase n=1 Tax=Herbiconiux moechotypicola TaxID=637393 RepID=A0ABP5Q3L0_9MICO|nr:L-aspartate oxidase [Herbiconiux moechotypicola]
MVVGSGIAGLVTALECARAGLDVTVVTKGAIDEGNTRHAQGGIAAAVMPGDTVASHVADTLVAGAGLSDPDAVGVLCEEGPAGIAALVEWGVSFDRVGGVDAAPDAPFDSGLEGAHSFHRILHAGGDASGLAVEQALLRSVRAAGIAVREHTFLIDLVREDVPQGGAARRDASPNVLPNSTSSTAGGGIDAAVCGVRVRTPAGVETLRADAVVLASGGLGQLYAQTTNPAVTTGDGAAAAWRAGAVLADVEFVQFHPTALAVPGSFLVSEAVRGDGAVLRNTRGERFMTSVHPLAELAPRDIVARAIAAEMRRTGSPVYLDATALGAEELEHRFPTISAACREAGFDWAHDPVPVAPAAHYWMGGVATDLDGRTSIPGLYAVGEVACTGVHGANRLASNSLLEGLVFARRCARALAALPAPSALAPYASPVEWAQSVAQAGRDATDRAHSIASEGRVTTRHELRELMQRAAGVVRDADGLRSALAALEGRAAVDGDRESASVEQLETENLLQLARLLLHSALAREESRGAHSRDDFAETSPAFDGHLVVSRMRPRPALAATVAEAVAPWPSNPARASGLTSTIAPTAIDPSERIAS